MKKGIVMDIEEDVLIMMTPEGEFLKGEKRSDLSYYIGKEVFFSPVNAEKRERSKYFSLNFWKVASVVAVLLISISITSASVFQGSVAYAYVSVDINPSMELAINNDSEVMDIIPYNKDAEKLLSELQDWEGKELSFVTKMIINKCEELGYLTKNHKIMIASVFTPHASNKDVKEITNEINSLEQNIENKTDTSITYKEATRQARKEAKEKGMTVGKFIKENTVSNKIKKDSKPGKEHKKEHKNKNKNSPEKKSNNSFKGKKQKLKDEPNNKNHSKWKNKNSNNGVEKGKKDNSKKQRVNDSPKPKIQKDKKNKHNGKNKKNNGKPEHNNGKGNKKR